MNAFNCKEYEFIRDLANPCLVLYMAIDENETKFLASANLGEFILRNGNDTKEAKRQAQLVIDTVYKKMDELWFTTRAENVIKLAKEFLHQLNRPELPSSCWSLICNNLCNNLPMRASIELIQDVMLINKTARAGASPFMSIMSIKILNSQISIPDNSGFRRRSGWLRNSLSGSKKEFKRQFALSKEIPSYVSEADKILFFEHLFEYSSESADCSSSKNRRIKQEIVECYCTLSAQGDRTARKWLEDCCRHDNYTNQKGKLYFAISLYYFHHGKIKTGKRKLLEAYNILLERLDRESLEVLYSSEMRKLIAVHCNIDVDAVLEENRDRRQLD